MAGPKTSIKIDVNEKPAVRAVKNLQKSFKRSFTEINAAISLGQKGWGLLTGAISGAVNATSEYVELANEQERVEKRVLASIRLRGKFTDENWGKLKEFNSALQQSLGLADEEILQAQGTLRAMGIRSGSLDEATKLTIALADVTGGTLKEASKQLAKAMAGDVGALKEAGIVAKDVADAKRQLAKQFDVVAAQADTAGSRMLAFNANLGDTKEVIGGAIIQSDNLRASIGSLSDFTLELQTIFASPEGRAAVNSFFGFIAGMAGGTIKMLLGVTQAFRDMVRNVYLLVGKDFKAGDFGASDIEKSLGTLSNKLLSADLGFAQPPGIKRPKVPGRAGFKGLKEGTDIKTGVEDPKAKQDALRRQNAEDTQFKIDMMNLEEQSLGEIDAALKEIRLEKEQEFKDKMVGLAESMSIERSQIRAKENDQFSKDIQFIVGASQEAGTQLVAGSILTIAQAIGEGENVLKSMGKFIGGWMTMIGQSMIQLGTVAVLAGTLGQVSGLFAGMTGGALGIGAGFALIAGGAVMAGLGAAMGGTGAGASKGAGAAGAAGSARAGHGFHERDYASQGSNLRDQQSGGTTIINTTFNGIVGNPRKAARDIADLLRTGQTLRPAGAGAF